MRAGSGVDRSRVDAGCDTGNRKRARMQQEQLFADAGCRWGCGASALPDCARPRQSCLIQGGRGSLVRQLYGCTIASVKKERIGGIE